jgi:hypothetical protein
MCAPGCGSGSGLFATLHTAYRVIRVHSVCVCVCLCVCVDEGVWKRASAGERVSMNGRARGGRPRDMEEVKETYVI